MQNNNDSLALLANCISGKLLRVERISTAYAWTDGATIYLPENVGKYDQVSVIAQSCLVASDSFDKKIMRRMVRSADQVVASYLHLELVRSVKEVGFRLPRMFSSFVENAVIDMESDGPENSFLHAINSGVTSGFDPALVGIIKPRMVLKGEPAVGCGRLNDVEIAKAFEQQLQRDEADEDDEKEESYFLKNMSLSIFSDNALSKMLRDVFGMSSNANVEDEDGASAGDLAPSGAQMVEKLGASASAIARRLGFELEERKVTSGFVYDEWDVISNCYKEGWCNVQHFEPDTIDTGAKKNLRVDSFLRRKVVKLTTDYQRHKRQPEGDDLDTDAVIEFAIEQRVGRAGSEQAIYEATRKTGRNLGVAILLDASESTLDAVADDESIWVRQKQLAFNLVSAFDATGDAVALFGFRSFGRNDVRFLPLKQFGKRLDSASTTQLNSIKPTGFTRLGAAIRHASFMVERYAGTDNRLVIVISDGIPYDSQYEDQYANSDVRVALKESIDRGVACICLSVGSSAEAEVVESVWGEASYATLDSLDELSGSFELLARSAMARAAKSAKLKRKVR